MRIVNTTATTRIITYRDGTQLVLPPAGGPAPNYVIRPNTDIDFLDDNAVQLGLFTAGILVLQNDDGSAYTGPALPAQPDAPAQQLRVYVNSKTRALSDINGSAIPSGGQVPSGRRFVHYGDSLDALECCLPTADTPIYGNPASVPQSQYNPRGVFSWVNALLGQPWDVVGARGVSGENSIQILARLNDVYADTPDFVGMGCGRNDVTQLASTYGGNVALCYSTTIANVLAIWDGLLARGVKIIYKSISPKQTSSGEGTPENTLVIRINTALKREAAKRKGVWFIDTFAVLVDTSIFQGYAKAALYVDTTHWATNGAFLQAQAVVTQLRPFIAPGPTLVSSQNDCFQKDTSSDNYLSATQGLMQGATSAAAGTGVSGTVQTSITVSRVAGAGSVVCSVVDATPAPNPIGDGVTGVGKAQRLVISGAAAADQFLATLPVTAGPTLAQLGAGSQLVGESLVQVSGATGLISVACEVVLVYTGGSPASPTRSRTMYPVQFTFDGTDAASYAVHLKTPPVQVPANATALTSITINWYAQFSKAGGATIDISRASIRKLAA